MLRQRVLHLARAGGGHVSRSLCVRAAGDLWIQHVSADCYRMGVSADVAAALGGIGFVDVPEGGNNLLLPGRPFAMIEGPKGMRTLESPITGFIMAANTELEDAPALADGGSANPDASWIVELEVHADDAAEQFETLPHIARPQ